MTKCDSFLKRGKKGVLITIGDEPILPSITSSELNGIFGKNQYPTSMLQAFQDCSESWDVHHIHVTSTYTGHRQSTKNDLLQMLHEKVHMTEGSQTTVEIPAMVSSIVINSYKGDTIAETPVVEETPTKKSELQDF